MVRFIVVIIAILPFTSCTKDESIEPQNPNWCGTNTSTNDTTFYKSFIKLQVEGNSSPDSVDFLSTTFYNRYGQHYFKRFINPNLTLQDSDIIYGTGGNDLSIIVYDSDTAKKFTSKIFKNNSILLQKIGKTDSNNKKFITTFIF